MAWWKFWEKPKDYGQFARDLRTLVLEIEENRGKGKKYLKKEYYVRIVQFFEDFETTRISKIMYTDEFENNLTYLKKMKRILSKV
ncbi:MAG: hypothetical protein CMH64_03165 [Nanoarchaeota archaeon]|nr:hypothetical protein [Nanoarchaeota archaeon]|tara:strand:- start:540 stop:794 length:255 start_codon:yes stop_codon:yes gene_type:complete